MSAKNPKNSIKKLVSLMGVAGASVFLSFPALALNNSNSSSFDGSLNNLTRRADSTGRSGQFLAQGTSGTGGTGAGTTGVGGTGTGTNGTNGTGGIGTGINGTNGTGGMGTGTNGTGGMGTGTNGTNGTGGMGTGTNGTTGTGTGGMGTGQTNGQQTSFEQLMNAGYAATQQRDYQTALRYFQNALQQRPGNVYATRAISNVQGYLRRGATNTQTNRSGTTNTPTNQGNR